MKRKFLEDLGLEKEAIDSIMTENGKDITAAKAEMADVETARDEWKEKYETAEATINTLKKDAADSEELQNTIATHEATIQNLQAESDSMKKEFSLKSELKTMGVSDPDYLIFKHGGVDHFSFDKDGKLIGLEETLKPYRESIPHLFPTGKKETKYEPNGGGEYKGVNPFAKETLNLTEQGKLLRTNPALAKEMANAAGIKI